MRSYIRHPTSIPIQICSGGYDSSRVSVRNLSAGGLCFMTSEPVPVGSRVAFWIPMIEPNYQGEGVIVWRKQRTKGYEVGVRFTSEDEYFRARMVEQVCRIEDYRQRLAMTGRQLTSEEAAREWISQFAEEFAKNAD